MRTFPTEQDLEQFRQRAESGQFTPEDLNAFYGNPRLWRPETALVAPEDAQTFWQMVYDELALEIGGRIIVPPVPRLTDKQLKSIAKYRLLLVYIPALTEDRYPECFVKPDRQKYLYRESESIPLQGRWVAVETIKKPDYNDPLGYTDDRLAVALKIGSRFRMSWDDLKNDLLEQAAVVTGLPRKNTRLPTAEEWNFVANLFNWLREKRGMDLPDLGLTRSTEWCENTNVSGYSLIVGSVDHGGLAYVSGYQQNIQKKSIAFRILFEL